MSIAGTQRITEHRNSMLLKNFFKGDELRAYMRPETSVKPQFTSLGCDAQRHGERCCAGVLI
jgi:hypothetical protein